MWREVYSHNTRVVRVLVDSGNASKEYLVLKKILDLFVWRMTTSHNAISVSATKAAHLERARAASIRSRRIKELAKVEDRKRVLLKLLNLEENDDCKAVDAASLEARKEVQSCLECERRKAAKEMRRAAKQMRHTAHPAARAWLDPRKQAAAQHSPERTKVQHSSPATTGGPCEHHLLRSCNMHATNDAKCAH